MTFIDVKKHVQQPHLHKKYVIISNIIISYVHKTNKGGINKERRVTPPTVIINCIILNINYTFSFRFSHAIILYLVKNYAGENNPLYPNDLEKQARINEILHFNNGQLYTSFENQYVNININNIITTNIINSDEMAYSPIVFKWS